MVGIVRNKTDIQDQVLDEVLWCWLDQQKGGVGAREKSVDWIHIKQPATPVIQMENRC